MAKIKLHTARALVDAGRSSQAQVLKMLKQAGIKPVQEIKTGKMTYRLFDQSAMDYIVARRAEKDAADAAPAQPPIPEPTPSARAAETQAAPDFAATLLAIDNARIRDMDEIRNGMAYLNRRLDLVLAQINALNTEMGVGASVLDGVAASLPDDAGRAQ